MRELAARAEEWPLFKEFRISRVAKTAAHVVVATIEVDGVRGRGECLPYPRYRESPESVLRQIDQVRNAIESGIGREELKAEMPAGAARNALDSALIDLESKRAGRRAWDILGVAAPAPAVIPYTLSLDNPEEMAVEAARHRSRALLKLKLGSRDAIDCVREVHRAAPRAELIVDANEAWTITALEEALDAFAACGVAMVEQPLPAGADDALATLASPIPIGADESSHTSEDLALLAERYQVVNIKLDKTGGLTEALAMADAARALGLDVMVGCMVATSLSMAPATLLTPGAHYVDLDGPLLLARDRSPGLHYEGDRVFPPEAALWG